MNKHIDSPADTTVRSLATLLANDCEPDERLDMLTQDTAALFKVPIAMINLVTSDQIFFKSCVGLTQGKTLERSGTFCSYAVKQKKPLVISDTSKDKFFQECALVTGPMAIRSYAGKSLHSPDGSPLGTLCIFDVNPRTYSSEQLEVLCLLAKAAEQQLVQIMSYVRATPSMAT